MDWKTNKNADYTLCKWTWISGQSQKTEEHRAPVCKTWMYVLLKWQKKLINGLQSLQETKLMGQNYNGVRASSFPCANKTTHCTRVPVAKPSQHEDKYLNCKGLFSVNAQAICSTTKVFMSNGAYWPGPVHNSRILKRWKLHTLMNSLLGDAILFGILDMGSHFGLSHHTEFCKLQKKEKTNNLHSREHVTADRCFGQLKQRFPVLHYTLRMDVQSSSVMTSCCSA
jgi:hypothetical protein